MNNGNTIERRTTRGGLLVAGVAALGLAFAAAAQANYGDGINPPRVPDKLEVPAGNRAFLVGHALGTQNYVCLPSATGGVAWSLFTPQATLFDDYRQQVVTHFFSPNPVEGGTVRATWEDSRDTSTFWGSVLQSSSDPAFVKRGAIAWVLLKFAGTQAGPTGGNTLTRTTFIQRVNTVGGSAPSTGCALSTDVGSKAFVPYRADYFFYEDATRTR
jgi:Protein of unknown function (DUF3455)